MYHTHTHTPRPSCQPGLHTSLQIPWQHRFGTHAWQVEPGSQSQLHSKQQKQRDYKSQSCKQDIWKVNTDNMFMGYTGDHAQVYVPGPSCQPGLQTSHQIPWQHRFGTRAWQVEPGSQNQLHSRCRVRSHRKCM